jgi:hypothetical protein
MESKGESDAVRKVAEYLYKQGISSEGTDYINENLLKDMFMDDAREIVRIVREVDDADE